MKAIRKFFNLSTLVFVGGLTAFIISQFPITENTMEVGAAKDVLELAESDNGIGYFIYTPKEEGNAYRDTFPEIPAYSGKPYYVIGDAQFDTDKETGPEAFLMFCELDKLGRCGWTLCCLGPETLATKERGSIGMIKPTGWWQNKYESIADAWNPMGFAYNRTHLVGHQLSGQDANELNLITGTRYMNVEGMLPFENMVADYIRKTGNHVLYMVTPVFEGDNLLAHGVRIEARSYEDDGKGINFDVFCYNVQPGIEIDYATGKNKQK